MKALLISDLHGDQNFLHVLKDILQNYDLILCTGDLTNFGTPTDYPNKLKEIVGKTKFLWISGNNDIGQQYQYSLDPLLNIDGKIVEYKGIKFSGIGGSSSNYEGQNFGPSIINGEQNISDTILLTHIPPSRALKYSINDYACQNGQHKLKNAPKAHLCGHLHHLVGTACIGNTKVIKIGAVVNGCYAELDLNSLEVKYIN